MTTPTRAIGVRSSVRDSDSARSVAVNVNVGRSRSRPLEVYGVSPLHFIPTCTEGIWPGVGVRVIVAVVSGLERQLVWPYIEPPNHSAVTAFSASTLFDSITAMIAEAFESPSI